MSRAIRTTGAALVGLTAVVALSGCELGESVAEKANGHIKTVRYATGAEGKNNADARLPGWVPDQATSVTEAVRTTGTERILRFTAPGAQLPPGCAPGPAATAAATLTAGWWPHGQESRTDRVCDQDWHVLVEGDAVYAFRPETIEQPPNGG
ncbi:hypothetical protein [Saccharopolyspora rosea]|nr:hypothetical protein [Saccharopolyspora rosea]